MRSPSELARAKTIKQYQQMDEHDTNEIDFNSRNIPKPHNKPKMTSAKTIALDEPAPTGVLKGDNYGNNKNDNFFEVNNENDIGKTDKEMKVPE